MRNLFNLATSEQGADRLARDWIANIDPEAAIGARHHIVPKFLLSRFANAEGHLRVRDRSTGAASTRSVGDLGVKDFYTSVTIHQTLDSSLETMFSEIEGSAATVIRTHVDAQAFSRPRRMTMEERFTLDTFVSFQFVRGMRTRRTMEMVADYGMKLMHQAELAPGDIENLSIVPHPNDHLRSLPGLSEQAFQFLAPRPLLVVQLDRPLLIIGDEPVAFSGDASALDRAGVAKMHNVDTEDIVHARGNRGGGLANASEVLLPVAPNVVLLYGGIGEQWGSTRVRITGADARQTARAMNDLALAAAVDWVAAHPDNAEFAEMEMPPAVPLLTVDDGGSEISSHTNSNRVRRPINRVRATDVHLPQIEDADAR